MADGAPHQSFRPRGRNRLDSHAGIPPNLFLAVFQHFLVQEFQKLLYFGRAASPLDPDINVFRVFAEDDHVHFFWLANGGGNAFEIPHRPHTRIQVQNLAQGDIQRTNPAPDGCGQGPLDAHAKIARRFDRIVREPLLEGFEGFLARKHFEPGHTPLPSVRFLDRGIKDAPRSLPDIPPRSISFDKGNNRIQRHLQRPVSVTDRLPVGRYRHPVVRRFHFSSPLHCLNAMDNCRKSGDWPLLRAAAVLASRSSILRTFCFRGAATSDGRAWTRFTVNDAKVSFAEGEPCCFRGAMAKRKLYHIGRALRNRIAQAEGQARPLASRRMTRMEAAFPIFASLSARDSQNPLRRSFRFGVEFVFLKTGSLARAHPCMRRQLRALDSVEAHSSKPSLQSLKLLALCGSGRWQKTPRAGGGCQASVGLEFEGRERCAEAGARRIRSAGDGSRRANSSAK